VGISGVAGVVAITCVQGAGIVGNTGVHVADVASIFGSASVVMGNAVANGYC